MISRISAVMVQEIQERLIANCQWVGLLEFPPIDMSSKVEVRSEAYTRQSMTGAGDWSVVRDGFIINNKDLTFTGLDSPIVVRAIGLFPEPGAGRGLTAWGSLDKPLVSLNGTVIVGHGTISLRIS